MIEQGKEVPCSGGICLLSCSPRANKSASRELALMAAQKLGMEVFEFDLAGHRRGLFEDRDSGLAFARCIESCRLVLLSFGSYFMHLPAQASKALGQLHEAGLLDAAKGKPAAAVMTSIKLGDDRALEFVRRTVEGLGMSWLGGFSAPGNPYFGYRGNQAYAGFLEGTGDVEAGLDSFAIAMAKALQAGIAEPTRYAPFTRSSRVAPLPAWLDQNGRTSRGMGPDRGSTSCLALLSGNSLDQDSKSLSQLIDFLASETGFNTETLYLSESNIRPCLGCYECEQSGKGECVLGDETFHMLERLASFDSIVVVTDLHLGFLNPALKSLIDRSWSKAHARYLQGVYALPVVCSEPRDIADAFQVADYLATVLAFCGARVVRPLLLHPDVPREYAKLSLFRLKQAVESHAPLPQMFSSIGARLMLRDYVYLGRPGLVLDYLAFKRKKMFDFPNKRTARAISAEVLRLLMKSPRARKFLVRQRRRLLDRKAPKF